MTKTSTLLSKNTAVSSTVSLTFSEGETQKQSEVSRAELREVPTFYETMAKGTPRVCVQREGAASLSLFDRPTGEECASVSIIFTNYSKIALRLSPFRINPSHEAKAIGQRSW